MQLEDLFSKPIDRSIEGVIKADDDVTLYVELDEYVVTNEVAKRLDNFLDAYLNYAGANGVWISGFFGSGKSHLLKMLAYLLENSAIEDIKPLDLFLEKSPFNEGGMFAKDLQRAVEIPSESILFNIDQKADVISKDELDALIAVFVKVFDEHCGYYGKQSYIAQFERELDFDGQFENFKTAFSEISGQDWESGRMRAKRMAQHVDQAYTKTTGTYATDILDKYRDDYRLSIEDFAEQVNAYVETKGTNFRLNFFVDEVGQYVAGNRKLMTNLQTVAESLSTKCKGRSWVIVTAQEEMDTVIGEVDPQSELDFSRIQDRFKHRMKLNSQDVAEVIQIRLLAKRQDYTEQLSELYHQNENNFKTLFDFADGSATFPNFRECDHFIQCYPFIPYQFILFQEAIKGLSRHSAFEGKHSSVGERSMLGVFQQVAIRIKDQKLGDLATFDHMFEGIRTTLVSTIQSSILRAENTLTNDFALRVLKALFLVKYVKEFKPTVRNICILMQNNFGLSITALTKDVEEVLALLENETLIQRNGDLFEYLTDEEQDVEAAIKDTEVDTQVVQNELEKLIFDGVIKNRKIRWDESGQDYPYTRKLDGNQIGREHELTIHIITSFHDHRDAYDKHKADTVYNDELCIILPDSDRLMRDLLLYKQTEKYISHETRTTQQDTVKRILAEKASQNGERYVQLKVVISKLMGQALYFVHGKELEIAGEDGQNKTIKAFIELIKQTYPNLSMLRGSHFQETDIPGIITQGTQGLFGDESVLPEAQQEMLSHIQSNSRGGIRTTVKLLMARFESKPYGWSYATVLCTLAHLCARGKIEVRESTNLLDDTDLVRALTNANTHVNLILDPQVEFTPGQTKKLKEFFNDYFDKVAYATEAKALAKETKEAFAQQKIELEKFHDQSEKYPFLLLLTNIISDLSDLEPKPYQWFVTELTRDEDKWIDNYKEQVIDPILTFMKGPNKKQLDAASQLVTEHKDNLSYVQADELDDISSSIVDPNIFKGNAVQTLVKKMQALKSKLDTEIESEKNTATAKIDNLENKLSEYDGFLLLEEQKKQEIQSHFITVKEIIEQQTLIAMVRDTANNFENEKYGNILQQILNWKTEEGENYKDNELSENETKPKSTIIGARDLKVSFAKPLLETENDIEDYLEAYRRSLLETVKQGKKVRV